MVVNLAAPIRRAPAILFAAILVVLVLRWIPHGAARDMASPIVDAQRSVQCQGSPWLVSMWGTTDGELEWCSKRPFGVLDRWSNTNVEKEYRCAAERTAKYKPVGFIGIPKTGSIFMQSMIASLGQGVMSANCEHPGGAWHHSSAALQQAHVGADAWDDAFTFAVVRNPWIRLVSWWVFITGFFDVCSAREHLLLAGMDAATSPECYRNVNQSRPECFREWVHRMRQRSPPGSSNASLFSFFPYVGNDRVASWGGSQLDWLVDERGTRIVDKVFKLEELEQVGWPELQERVCGLERIEYAEAKRFFRVNPTRQPTSKSGSSPLPYAAYYDEATLRIASEYVAEDAATFGYAPPQIA